MPAAPALSFRKSTNVRFNTRFAAARVMNALLARISPERAERAMRAAMLTPQRPKDGGNSDLVRTDNAARVPYGGRWLRVWSFGEGPAILLAHGWSGHAAQFDAWIEPLVSAGYRVVLFDAPAHGRSGGAETNLVDMGGAVQHVAGLYGPLHAIVAHSFGAPATLFALQHGLAVDRLVLIVHDKRDREVPFSSSERLLTAMPAARLVATDGSGHNRILRNAQVIGEAIRFVGAKRAIADAPVRAAA